MADLLDGLRSCLPSFARLDSRGRLSLRKILLARLFLRGWAARCGYWMQFEMGATIRCGSR